MQAIYDEIGIEYDTTRKADPSILEHFNSLLAIENHKRYLDIACGTGNYTAKLADIGGDWYAFDHSEEMLTKARTKSSLVQWKQADVSELSYEDNYFDGAICSLAIHHFPDLGNAFSEIARVLKPNSSLVIFTATPDQMRSYWLARYFPNMLDSSCDQMPTIESIELALRNTSLSIKSTTPFFITPELQDFFLYSGKQRPEMYLSSAVRNGISSFHNYCDEPELERGLESLRKDIESGAINEVMEDFANKLGDYLFLSMDVG